jgi:Dna[CI] antecedent DciA-like protein
MTRPLREGFSLLEATTDGVLRRMASGESALLWIQARWPRLVGEPLVRKIAPASLAGRRLTLSLLDPGWRKPVEAALPELERKLAFELPSLRPRVLLRPPEDL